MVVGGFGDVRQAVLRSSIFSSKGPLIAVKWFRPTGDRKQRIRVIAVSTSIDTVYQSVAASGTAPVNLAVFDIPPTIAQCIEQSWRLDPKTRPPIADHLPVLRSVLARCVSVRHEASCTDTVHSSPSM